MAKIRAINFKNPAKSDLVVAAFKGIKGVRTDAEGVELAEDELLESYIRDYIKDVVKAYKIQAGERQARLDAEVDNEVF